MRPADTSESSLSVASLFYSRIMEQHRRRENNLPDQHGTCMTRLSSCNKRYRAALTICALLFLVCGGYGQPQISEEKAIEHVKKLPAPDLDSVLPAGHFSEWLRGIFGEHDSISWEMNDCGEQSGDPGIDSTRDIPICVGITAHMADGRTVGITIAVGTTNNGLAGPPGVYDIYLEKQGKIRTVKRLSELKHVLRSSPE